MSGIHLNLVRQRQQLVAQCVIHHPGHDLGRVAFASREIRPSHIADKESVAGKDFQRLIRNVGVDDQD